MTEAAKRAFELYEPIGVLKPVTDDVWIVDGPVIDLSVAGLGLPFTTRMTVVRLANGDLLLHSPVDWSAELQRALAKLGPIQYLVAPKHAPLLVGAGLARPAPQCVGSCSARASDPRQTTTTDRSGDAGRAVALAGGD